MQVQGQGGVTNMDHGSEINKDRFWTASLISHASQGPTAQHRNLQLVESQSATGTNHGHWDRDGKQSFCDWTESAESPTVLLLNSLLCISTP